MCFKSFPGAELSQCNFLSVKGFFSLRLVKFREGKCLLFPDDEHIVMLLTQVGSCSTSMTGLVFSI